MSAYDEQFPGELAMLRELVRTLRVVVRPDDADVAEVRRLLDAIRTHGGEWTTSRVLAVFALTDPGVVQRGTARRDLETLHRAGHLVLVDDPDKRH